MISPLLTDLYQLTMAYGYWKLGLHDREAVFHLIFRKNPFRGHYAVACGLETVIEFLQNYHFSAEDLNYLRNLTTASGEPLFQEDFLTYLSTLRFTCDVDAIPEGTVVFPQEPLLRIQGPLLQGQLIESTLLNIINFQTLIATKASRIYQIAQGDTVLEFGLRRAQGPDGALSASRAAYIGGCAATSNVLAGKLYDIPVRGTHAHSWVTAFSDELSAFKAYAEVMPHNCILLVDTYNTIQGVKNAIIVGKELREKGIELQGVRLDSGDMASISFQVRQLLDEAGFTQTKIIASNSLNENVITEMKEKGAPISVWGVGTQLVTSYDHPALDGVYKLSALRDEQGQWQYKLKLSEQSVKISNPGIYQIRRFFNNEHPVMDVMFDELLGTPVSPRMTSFDTPYAEVVQEKFTTYKDLLIPVFRKGELVKPNESMHSLRERAIQEVSQFIQTQSMNPFPVGLEKNLHEIKQKLITQVLAENR